MLLDIAHGFIHKGLLLIVTIFCDGLCHNLGCAAFFMFTLFIHTLKHALQRCLKIRRLDGLEHILKYTQADGSLSIAEIGISRQNTDAGVRGKLSNLLNGLQAIHFRQHNIHNDDIGTAFFSLPHRLSAGIGRNDNIFQLQFLVNHRFNKFQFQLFVFHNQNRTQWSHLEIRLLEIVMETVLPL